MKLFTKIKAFFNFRGKQKEIEATEVEVRQDTIYIHPTEDESKVLAIKSGMVDIFVDPEKELSDDDVQIFDKEELKKKREKKDKTEDDKKQNPDKKRHTRNYIPRRGDWYPNEYIRRKITFSVYQDEYDMLSEILSNSGYHRTEYFLACVTAA